MFIRLLVLLVFTLQSTCTAGNNQKLDRVVKGSGKSIYTITPDGSKHHVPDWDTFVALGFGINSIETISDKELDALPLGPALGQSDL